MEKFEDEIAKKRYLLGQYDTDPAIAESIIDLIYQYININNKNPNHIVFMEPAAGNGIFFDLLYPYMIGIDIDESLRFKGREEYIFEDFLSINNYEDIIRCLSDSQNEIKILSRVLLENNLLRQNTIIITNPPFSVGNKGGKTTDLALKFLNKSAEFADTIGMILPATFNKKEKQNRVHPELHLIYSENLPTLNTFKRRGNIDKNESLWTKSSNWSVKTVFQLWVRKYDENGNIIRRKNEESRWSLSKYKDGSWIYQHPVTGEILQGDFIILKPTDQNCNLMIKKWSNPTIIGQTEDNPEIIKKYIQKNIILEEKRNNDEKYLNRLSKKANRYYLDRSHVPDYFLYAYDVNYVKNLFKKAKPYIEKNYKNTTSTNHATLSQIDMIIYYLNAKYDMF